MPLIFQKVITIKVLFLSGIIDACLLIFIGNDELVAQNDNSLLIIGSLFIASSLLKVLSTLLSSSLASILAKNKIKKLWEILFDNKSLINTKFNLEEIKTSVITCGDKLIFQFYLPILNLIGAFLLLIFNIGALFFQYGNKITFFILILGIYMLLFKLVSYKYIKKNAKYQLSAVEGLDIQVSNLYSSSILRESTLNFNWINKRFFVALNSLSKFRWRNGFVATLPKSGLEIVGGFLFIFILLVKRDSISTTDILIAALASLKIIPAFQSVSYNFSTITDGKISYNYVQKLINQFGFDVKEKKSEIKEINYDFNFVNIVTKEKNIINDITIKKGIISTLQGESGSGKSTFCKYLSGISQSEQIKQLKTEINIDGIEISAKEFKKFIYYSEQFSPIMSGNILENLGLREEQLSNNKIKKIITNVFSSKMISLLYKKDNILDRLSGGEIARIGICRAILSNKSILIFDEPFASLDKNSTNEIISILKRYSKFKLILIISHQFINKDINPNYFLNISD